MWTIKLQTLNFEDAYTGLINCNFNFFDIEGLSTECRKSKTKRTNYQLDDSANVKRGQ